MYNHKRQMSNRMRTFIKSFVITICIVFTLITIGILTWNRTVVPPEIPTINTITVATNPELNDPTEQTTRTIREHHATEIDEPTTFEYVLTAPERFTDDDRRDMFFTFLIIGLNEGVNANTVMVASYCGITREANLISIPRDMPVHPTRRGRKLSSSYIAGSGGGRGREGGIAQVQRDVLNVIGFIPDFYVVIDYDAFFNIIDAVGGVEVYVPFNMVYDDPCQNLHINIQPGLQLLNGERALHFARFRLANDTRFTISDYQRIENQQAVVNAVISQLLRPSNILQIPEFVRIFNDSVDTNLTVGNMLWFANQINDIRGTDALSSYTMPTAGTSGAPMWYELLDAPRAVALINRTVNPFYQNIELRDLNVIS